MKGLAPVNIGGDHDDVKQVVVCVAEGARGYQLSLYTLNTKSVWGRRRRRHLNTSYHFLLKNEGPAS